MKLKCKVLCALLCLTAFICAVSSEAAVSVKGKNLDDIEDIISTATGGSANIPKYSLGIMRYMEEVKGGGGIIPINQAKQGNFFIKQISGDASAASAKYESTLLNDYVGGSSFTGMYAAASSLSNRYGRGIMWFDFKRDNANLKYF